MKLRVEGDLKNPRIVNAATGEELEGVKEVVWRAGGFSHKCEITLDGAAIDVSINAARVEATTREDGKYAHTKLLDIAGLRWTKRRRNDGGDS